MKMISVCMATYNGQDVVIRQLESIIKQLDTNDQILIVDDRSTDNTVKLIREHYGDRVEIHINETNSGPIKSFEKAISLAKGDFIFLSDQDDIWENDKVAKVQNAFQDPDVMLVTHDAYVVDGNLKIIELSWNTFNNNDIEQGLFGNIIKNAYTGCMMAFRKELKPLILPFPDSIEMHDQWIALVCMIERKKIVHISEPLMKYVRHGGNVTAIKRRSLTTQLKGRIGTIQAILSHKKKH